MLPELIPVAAEASAVVSAEALAAFADFDACAGAVCREIAARYRSGAPQAACAMSLVSAIVAEDSGDAGACASSRYCDDPMFRMLDRCAAGLPAFIEGRLSGVDVIFPKGERRLWADVQGRSLHMAGYGRLLSAAVRALMPASGQILEIGAGSGSATAALLDRVGGQAPVRYVVSDISPTLLRDARARFAEAKLGYAIHDFTRPAGEQGLAGQRFELVFGVNALHCAADVRAALRNTLALVMPGGYLILAEGARPASGRVWRPELIFALLPGWWQVQTDPRIRPDPGFLSGAAWAELLTDVGCPPVDMLPLGSAATLVIGYLIVARKVG